MPKAGARRATTRSHETQGRLVDATRTLLATGGYVGATARAIGDEAGCNQALVFYHFGSLNDLLLAALDASVAEALARYESELSEADGLREVLAVARSQYRTDRERGHINVVAQMVAGGVVDPELGRQVADRIEPWIDLTRRAIARALPGAARRRLPIDELAYALVALFLGAELLAILAGTHERTEAALRRLTSRGLLARLTAS